MSSLLKTASPRSLSRLAAHSRSHSGASAHFLSTSSATSPDGRQAQPMGRYYEIILNDPTPYARTKPENPPISAAAFNAVEDGRGTASRNEPQVSASGSKTFSPAPRGENQIMFGSKLSGPAERAERLAAMKAQSRLIAGVMVPPKPEEPDNCCMSGCVNCVWDRFREEMEEWSSANAEAEKRLRAQEAGLSGVTSQVEVKSSELGEGVSADQKATPTSTTKTTKDLWDDQLYSNLPVHVTEFMKLEKKLKLKHAREGTTGG